MRIAIPIEDADISSGVCVSFGRAPYFLIYDTETKQHQLMVNQAASSQGGAGIKAAQIVADQDIEALLTPRCGENAAEVIRAAKITIYQTTGTSVMDNIDAFFEGRLPVLTEIHAGFHGRGGR